MSGAQLFNNTSKWRHRRKQHREVSMSDVMPKFDNTLQMKLEAPNMVVLLAEATGTSNHLGATYNGSPRITLVEFLKIYPCLEEWEFLSCFTVSELITLRLLCKDTAAVVTDELLHTLIRIGNLDNSLRLNFWVIQAPFFE